MRILENHIPEQSFIEKKVSFSLKNGLKIEYDSKNCEVKCYLVCEGSENFIALHENSAPAIDVISQSFLIEFDDEGEEDEEDEEDAFIEWLDINENSSCEINMSKDLICAPQSHLYSTIIVPPDIIRNMSPEAEIMKPDGITFIVKDCHDFAWGEHGLSCILMPSYTYGVRMRGRIGDKSTAWSNRILFKVPTRRSLGRTSRNKVSTTPPKKKGLES